MKIILDHGPTIAITENGTYGSSIQIEVLTDGLTTIYLNKEERSMIARILAEPRPEKQD